MAFMKGVYRGNKKYDIIPLKEVVYMIVRGTLWNQTK